MTSGQLTATTLTILQFNEDFPQEFETILTTADGSKQFQLRTVIAQRTDFKLDNINSPEWLIMPPAELWFNDSHGRLDVKCAVFMPKDTSGFTNELIMYRATPMPNNPLKMDISTVVRIHKDTQNFAERQMDATLFGRRHLTPAGHMIYQVGFTARNATASFDGIYQCGVERQSDRLIAISTVTSSATVSTSSASSSTRHRPLIPGEPHVELVSCERGNYDKQRETLTLSEGAATCFRCRAIGQPRPEVSIHRGNDKSAARAGRAGYERVMVTGLRKSKTGFGARVAADEDVAVNTYVNVADAGIAEITYTIHRTRSVVHSGRYVCMASNSVATTRVQFSVVVRHKKTF